MFRIWCIFNKTSFKQVKKTQTNPKPSYCSVQYSHGQDACIKCEKSKFERLSMLDQQWTLLSTFWVSVLTVMFTSVMWSLMFFSENAGSLSFMEKGNGKISKESESFQKASRPHEQSGCVDCFFPIFAAVVKVKRPRKQESLWHWRMLKFKGTVKSLLYSFYLLKQIEKPLCICEGNFPVIY